MDKFKLENLGSGITAVISKEHGFGTDARRLRGSERIQPLLRHGQRLRDNPIAVAQKEYEQTCCRH